MTRPEFEKGGKIRRIERELENPAAALKAIGTIMVAASQDAFRAQAFGGQAWEPRAPINVYGIIADFAQGRKNPPQRRFERRPALQDTGRLARSIAFQVVGTRAVDVGTRLEYAGVHQFGGPVESEKITPEVRRNLWRWLKRQSRDLRNRLGWLLNKKFKGKTLKGEVPARPFVGVTDQIRDDVAQVVGVKIFEVR